VVEAVEVAIERPFQRVTFPEEEERFIPVPAVMAFTPV
jgi:hypothetical protein